MHLKESGVIFIKSLKEIFIKIASSSFRCQSGVFSKWHKQFLFMICFIFYINLIIWEIIESEVGDFFSFLKQLHTKSPKNPAKNSPQNPPQWLKNYISICARSVTSQGNHSDPP
jgi:hypothetical protein